MAQNKLQKLREIKTGDTFYYQRSKDGLDKRLWAVSRGSKPGTDKVVVEVEMISHVKKRKAKKMLWYGKLGKEIELPKDLLVTSQKNAGFPQESRTTGMTDMRMSDLHKKRAEEQELEL